MCRKLKMAWITACYNFRLWRHQTRVTAAFLLGFILSFLLTDKIISFAAEQGTPLQLVEAFVWTFGDSSSILLVSLLLLLVFGDMPFITPATPFFLVRETRRTWMLGQVIYIVLATVLYLAFILLSTCLLCFKQVYPADIWSETSAILAFSGKGKELLIPAAAKTLEMGRPYRTMLFIFLLMLLYTLVMVFLMFVFHLWKGQAAGIAAALVFSAYGMILDPVNIQKILNLPDVLFYRARVWIGWLSPLNHATYYMHDFGFDDLPSLRATVVIFCVLLAVLAVTALRLMRSYSFQFKGTEK